MNQQIRDALNQIRLHIPDGYDATRPIFAKPPENLDESWQRGGIAGGLAWRTPQIEVARAYRFAASAVIELALEDDVAWRAVYPALFLYRHAIEVTLKALYPEAPYKHGLNDLIDCMAVQLDVHLSEHNAQWVKARLYEFATIDPTSTAFRYAGAKLPGEKEQRQDGEWWVDFEHLHDTMEIVLQVLEVMAWGKDAAKS